MTLWAVSIQGPDDLIAAKDYEAAMEIANGFNNWWQELNTRVPLHDQDPRMWANPVEWPHDDASHAKALADPPSDYRAFFSDLD